MRLGPLAPNLVAPPAYVCRPQPLYCHYYYQHQKSAGVFPDFSGQTFSCASRQACAFLLSRIIAWPHAAMRAHGVWVGKHLVQSGEIARSRTPRMHKPGTRSAAPCCRSRLGSWWTPRCRGGVRRSRGAPHAWPRSAACCRRSPPPEHIGANTRMAARDVHRASKCRRRRMGNKMTVVCAVNCTLT